MLSTIASTQPRVLGVAGGTGSGKTTVVRSILEAVGRDRIALIEQDNYYRDVDWTTDASLLDIPCITTLSGAMACAEGIAALGLDALEVRSLQSINR